MEEIDQELHTATKNDVQEDIQMLKNQLDEIFKAQKKIQKKMDAVRETQVKRKSSGDRFIVKDEDGNLTEQGKKLRDEVIKQSPQGMKTEDVVSWAGVQRPTARDKMEHLSDAVDDIVYDKSLKYTVGCKLYHQKVRGAKNPDKRKGELLSGDKEFIECENSAEHPMNKPVGAVRKVWLEHYEWECPECGRDPR